MNINAKKELIKEAIREYQQESQKEEQKERKKKVYHNTELLMKHYNELKQHSENAVYKASQIFQNGYTDDTEDDYEDSDLYIGTILKSKVRTSIMVQHIEVALTILKDNAVQNCFDNKYNAFADLYIQNLQYNQLAAKYNCTEMTIRRWKNEMINKLGILLFGEEGLILGA